MNNRLYHILEIFWLIVAILGLIAGIHQTYTQGLKESWLFFLIALVGFAMFYMRRTLRKKQKK
jgi:uncharacterized membrane protein